MKYLSFIVLVLIAYSCGKENLEIVREKSITKEVVYYQKTLSCKSVNNVQNCFLDLPYLSKIREVLVSSQLTSSPCIVGKTWDIDLVEQFVFVKDSCQANFKVIYSIE